MSVYRVVNKRSGQTVYAYSAEAAVEFAEYPEAEFAHVQEVAVRPDGTIAPLDPAQLITKRAFWNRIPQANEVAMRGVLLSGTPALLAAGLERLRARVDASPYVDLALPETAQGIQWLASSGVPETVTLDGVTLPMRLTQQQAADILGAAVDQSERWQG